MAVRPGGLLRPAGHYEVLTFSFLLTFAVGAAVGLGCYLRLLDARRARAVASVRQSERMELARDLHDFVAHHVTGIIVHANAALVIQETSPEQIKPLLEGISRAGGETLDSMRRLVRVLREDDHRSARPGDLPTELDRLVSAFAENGTDATLNVAPEVRGIRLAPEVETSVHRVVQEALTNVRRHAHGADVVVRLELDPRGHLRVEARNTAPQTRSTGPIGGFTMTSPTPSPHASCGSWPPPTPSPTHSSPVLSLGSRSPCLRRSAATDTRCGPTAPLQPVTIADS
ncbi:histidine kinase [Streptomyces europaeiscabiei]|uniref:sensor histidine kinase n=1 Tax=Streptomyces europaeiscabiei TaxID=146819 RepID=UPI002E170AC8